MRYHAAAILTAALISSPATAADLPNEGPEGKRWMSCYIRLKDANSTYIGETIAVGGYWLVAVPANSRKETQDRLRDVWVKEYAGRIPSEFPGKVGAPQHGGGFDARCNSFKSRAEWAGFVAHVKEPLTSKTVLRSDFVPSFAQGWVSTREHARDFSGKAATSGPIGGGPAGKVEIRAPDSYVEKKSNGTADETEAARKKARDQREAEWQAKIAAHQENVADYQRKVEAREAEIARQQREHAAAQDAAAREIDAHRRQLAQADRRQQEYSALQRRHALCVGGDQKACADIETGKPAISE